MDFHILVVEDSPTQAEALGALLEERYTVTVAGSGEEALEKMAVGRFDLVLSDILMPGLGGYELCQRIKSNPAWHDTPVVLLTSLSDPMDIVRGLEVGADNYITKPYEREHLLARLGHVLGSHRLRRISRTSLGVKINFLGSEVMITSEREQIIDLLLSSIEDVVRSNRALEESQRELAEAHAELEAYAREKAREADVSAERYRTLMQNAGDAVFVLNAQGTILEAGTRATELLGRPLDEIVGRRLADFAVADQKAAARERFAEVLEGKPVGRLDRSFERPDGTVVLCEATPSLTRVGDERLVLVICRDITERRRAEEAVARSRDYYMSIFDRLPALIRGSNESGSCDYVNRAYLEFTGRTQEEELGEGWIEGIHPEDKERCLRTYGEAMPAQRPFEVEYRLRHHSGEYRWVLDTGRPLYDLDGHFTGYIGSALDIHEHRRTEEHLRQAQKMEAIGRLAGGIAHDFNNVLTAIMANVQILLLDLPEEDGMREDLKDINRAATRAAGLTRQLLAFSRQQVLQPRMVDLNEIVAATERMLRLLIGEDVELICNLAADLDAVCADPSQVEQIIMNLVVNARDAMVEGGTLNVQTDNVEVGEGETDSYAAPVQPGRYVVLSVRDTGHGMDEATLGQIFEPFFTTKEQGKGTGLGLPTVYGIVKQSGGYIWAESVPGEGTVFRIYLPCGQAAPEVSENPEAAIPVGHEETILVVEDEPSVRAVTRRMLVRSGYRVLEASNGEEALRLVQEHGEGIDLVLTDVVMPHMGGAALAMHLSTHHPGMRVLYISGYTDDQAVLRGIQDGGAPFLQKPFSMDQLARRVREVLGSRPRFVDG